MNAKKAQPVVVPFLRTPYNYDRDAASDESGLACEDVSLARQSFAEECDINTIVKRFGVTGVLPNAVVAPQYGDFEGVMDYQTAMNAVVEAQTSFMAMDGHVRARFGNSPQAFLEFCSDPANRPEMQKLGLIVPGRGTESIVPGRGTESAPPGPGTGAEGAVPIGGEKP